MAEYRFEDIAINSTEKKKPVESDKEHYLGLEHLDSGTFKVSRFGSEVAPIGDKLIMKKGDVLFGKRRAYQKKVAIAPFDGIFSAHGMVLRPKEDVIDKNFFPLFIASDYFLDAAIKISVGSLSPTINWRDLKELKFNLPELEEQKKLAEILWQIVATMESYKKLLAKTDEMIKAKFVEMFGDPTKFKSEKLSKNVEEMFIGPFGSDLKNNCFVSKDEAYCIVYEQKHAISGTITDENRYITEKKYQQLKRFTLLPGDIIVSCRGTIGKIFLLPENAPLGIMHPSIMKIRLKKDTYNKKFFISLLRNKMDELINKADGTSVKMAITATKLGNIDFIIPNLTLQNKYVDLLDRAEESKSAIQASLDSLSAVYKKIIAENLGDSN